jgi:hypothetical protein
LPLSLRGWYEDVGRVNLAGQWPDIEYKYTDPLVVDAPLDYLRSEYLQWFEDRDTDCRVPRSRNRRTESRIALLDQ